MSDSKFTTDDGIILPPRQMAVFYLSGHVWEFIRHTGEKYDLQWIDGREHDGVDLRQGEAILDLATFYALGLNEMDEPVYTFRFPAVGDDYLETTVKIVGTIDLGGSFFKETTDGLEYNKVTNNPSITHERLFNGDACLLVDIWSVITKRNSS
jgi:hypothetical protein